MNMDTEKRVHELFAGVSSSLKKTDPEFTEIIANFSQGEVVEANKLTEKEQMLCILSALLGCQGMGEFQNMLHAALNMGIDPIAIKELSIRQRPILESGVPMISLWRQIRLWSSMGLSCRLRRRRQQMKRPDLKMGLPDRWSCSERIWRSVRPTAPFFAGISTVGWQITALGTTTHETA